MATRINKAKKYASLRLDVGDRFRLYSVHTHVKPKDLTSFQNSMRKLTGAHQTVPSNGTMNICVCRLWSKHVVMH